jgi:cyclopropane fatty-acyl-phospholipid synthase-like methyltransferase
LNRDDIMRTAATIADVAARHAWVFDNGASDQDFFDLPKRVQSNEFWKLLEHVGPDDSVFEIGCLTGLNLLGLATANRGRSLVGIDFVGSAVQWMLEKAVTLGVDDRVSGCIGTFDSRRIKTTDRVICFDVLEHQLDVGAFLTAVKSCLRTTESEALFLVPEGAHYNDCGHVAWFPNPDCLRNVLEYFFDVHEIEVLPCHKIFAACRLPA